MREVVARAVTNLHIATLMKVDSSHRKFSTKTTDRIKKKTFTEKGILCSSNYRNNSIFFSTSFREAAQDHRNIVAERLNSTLRGD